MKKHTINYQLGFYKPSKLCRNPNCWKFRQEKYLYHWDLVSFHLNHFVPLVVFFRSWNENQTWRHLLKKVKDKISGLLHSWQNRFFGSVLVVRMPPFAAERQECSHEWNGLAFHIPEQSILISVWFCSGKNLESNFISEKLDSRQNIFFNVKLEGDNYVFKWK